MIRLFVFSVLVCGIMAFVEYREPEKITPDQKVSEILEMLGEDLSDKKPKYEVGNVSALVGEDIVKYGSSSRADLKNAKRQSKYFVCTTCHNVVREDPDIKYPDPQERLVFASDKGVPFLQGTTLWGAVNRETYYNGDYELKYGDLVKPARNNIREAIQLCATECSQGRKLEDWELESVLAYLWELQLTIADLDLSEEESQSIGMAFDINTIQGEARKLLKSKYSLASEATWIKPPEDRKKGTGLQGNQENGQLIYESSCLHCHYQKKYSFLHLDNNKMSFTYLNRKAPTYSRHSLYQVVRYGTDPKHGKKAYMPFYTAEKMTEQQLADLRAYIAHRAKS